MPFQGEAKDGPEGMSLETDLPSEDIRLTLFIASSSFIIMTLITIIGVVSCVILCNDNDLVSSGFSGSDSLDLWPSEKDLGKRYLNGQSVEDEFMEGTVTPGHLLSPDGGSIHWLPSRHQLPSQKLPLINHPFTPMATTRLDPVRNYPHNKELTPITEISVEETQTSIDTNEASDITTPLLGLRSNGSCVSEKSDYSDMNRPNEMKDEKEKKFSQSLAVNSSPQTDRQSLSAENQFYDEIDALKSGNLASLYSVSSQILGKSDEQTSGRPETLHLTPHQLLDLNIYFTSGSSNSNSPQNLVKNAEVTSGRYGLGSDGKPVPPRPPRRTRRNGNSQTESKSSQSSTSSTTTTNEIPSRNLIQLEPLQLNVALAPVSGRPQSAGPAFSGNSRLCKHCNVSQHNFLAPERIDKASNTEKSSSQNKHL